MGPIRQTPPSFFPQNQKHFPLALKSDTPNLYQALILDFGYKLRNNMNGRNPKKDFREPKAQRNLILPKQIKSSAVENATRKSITEIENEKNSRYQIFKNHKLAQNFRIERQFIAQCSYSLSSYSDSGVICSFKPFLLRISATIAAAWVPGSKGSDDSMSQ